MCLGWRIYREGPQCDDGLLLADIGDKNKPICLLTLETRTNPSPDITVDTRPHKMAGHKPLDCMYSRMREVVESIENSSAETLRYICSLNASGHIANDFESANGTRSKWSEE